MRQPAVRWLSPTELLRTGFEVMLSGWFGKFADKRELQSWPVEPSYRYAYRDSLWVDFIADVGDGWEPTYTMAWLLAKDALEVQPPDDRAPSLTLPRGEVLLFGGDQVYPTPGVEAYTNRFLGPYRAALPESKKHEEAYAIPGNHDWYDGLGTFLRVFCQRGNLGGRRFAQKRSYFALKLPHRWWVLGIDIQLDTYVDREQRRFFESLPLTKADRVVLVTGKPSWVRAELDDIAPLSYRVLAFVEREFITKKGAQLALAISGDLHHYSRYEPFEHPRGPQRITAGGGGAYLSATHTLPRTLLLKPWYDEDAVTYRCTTRYPTPETSRRLGRRIWRTILPTNPTFAAFLALLYAAIGLTFLGALNSGQGGLVDRATSDGLGDFFARGVGGGLLSSALFAVLIVFYTDFKNWFIKVPVGVAHAAAHLAGILFGLWGLLNMFSAGASGVIAAGVATIGLLLAGALFGPVLFGLYLLLAHRWSRRHTNDLFAGQGIVDYKNFVRMHIDTDGALTLYPLKVDRVTRRWDLAGVHTSDGEFQPTFEPRDEAPMAELIEEPIRL